MNGTPQKKKDQEINDLILFFRSLGAKDFNNFSARRAYKISKELNDKYPQEWRLIVLLAASSFSVDKKEEALKLFENLTLSRSSKSLESDYITINTAYAELLYSNKNYNEALEILQSLGDFINDDSYISPKGIYFEKDLYIDLLHNIGKSYKRRNSLKLTDAVYQLFIYYYYSDKNNIISSLDKISQLFCKEKMTRDNIELIFEKIEEYITSITKPEVTEKEKIYLEGIKNFLKMNFDYQGKKIKIIFNDKEYNLRLEIYPNSWFYGEIEEIENCRSQAKSLIDLENSILQYLDLIVETGSDYFVPSKELLQEIRLQKEFISENSDNELNQWLSEDLDEHFYSYQEDSIPIGKPVKYVSGVGLIYTDG